MRHVWLACQLISRNVRVIYGLFLIYSNCLLTLSKVTKQIRKPEHWPSLQDSQTNRTSPLHSLYRPSILSQVASAVEKWSLLQHSDNQISLRLQIGIESTTHLWIYKVGTKLIVSCGNFDYIHRLSRKFRGTHENTNRSRKQSSFNIEKTPLSLQ